MLTVRHVQTKHVPALGADDAPVLRDGVPVLQIVPELDADGREIELWSITVPPAVEAAGADAINAYLVSARPATPAANAPAVLAATEPLVEDAGQ